MKKSIVKIYILLFLGIIMLSLIGCSNNKIEKLNSIITEEWNSTSIKYDDSSFMKAFDEYAHFEVINIDETEKDCFIVTCNVTSPDVLEKLKNHVNNLADVQNENDINKTIVEFINNSELKTTEQTIRVYKIEDGYSVVFSEEFIDAMYGYSYSYCRSEINNMINQLFE